MKQLILVLTLATGLFTARNSALKVENETAKLETTTSVAKQKSFRKYIVFAEPANVKRAKT
ncbi:MAG: hypothetical protein IPJ32_15645 [Sphingobacteriaceae bacterium]|nr:hypothetical protein [Sphingobacteriaceae bacterium]